MSVDALRVLFVASEADPWIKVGGLGDVAGSLPAALRALGGLDVRLAIPFHPAIPISRSPMTHLTTVDVPHASGPIRAEIYQTWLGELPVYLIGGGPIATAASVYSEDGGFDAHKYIYFSLACLEFPEAIGWQPHILHAHDWHTAAAVYSLALRRGDPASFYHACRSVLSVHNLPYLGNQGAFPMQAFGLPPLRDAGLPDWAQQLPFPAGLASADRIVAVSPSYAREILTPEYGSGLHDFLSTRQEVLSGILNGLDTLRWDPETDTNLAQNFEIPTLPRRILNKRAIQQEFNLPKVDDPLAILISRFDYQKGIDIALPAFESLSDARWQAILLGTGNPEYQDAARLLEARMPSRVRAAIRFDGALSRRLYAAADMLLIPSRYEPCGLTQMIGMRYGCIPVARATGGLRDTILDDPTLGVGFLFSEATPTALAAAMRRAFAAYDNPSAWAAMQTRAMNLDFSWRRSAQQYQSLYSQLVS